MGNNCERVDEIRCLISEFIEQCFEKKYGDIKEDNQGYLEAKRKYEYSHWINDVARRLESSLHGKNPIKVATHISKAVHPDSKGANLYVDGASRDIACVSTFSLEEGRDLDVVGNAAYKLNEYKFLFLKTSSGELILELAKNKDPDLSVAISEDSAYASEMMDLFSKVIDPVMAAGSQLKQFYWLAGDDPTSNNNFHLLAPLYASSLAHKIHNSINEHRFGDGAKEARKARWENRYSETGYPTYTDLAVQKLGGTKPQNISQLNSERGGKNYLLASLPPTWVSSDVKPPLFVDSVFDRFGRRRQVREMLSGLRKLLRSDPTPNKETRDRRDEFLGALIDELVLFARSYSVLEPGWSASADCHLVEAEALWLDLWREDGDFAQRREAGEWTEQVRHRFANWLNSHLSTDLPVGETEHAFWAKHLKQQLDALQEVLPYV